MHKYTAIVMDIRSRISSGEYRHGDRLPTTTELCAHWGVSKITVKRAMDELESLGLIARRRGAGTYVKGASSTRALTGAWSSSRQMDGFVATAIESGHIATSDVHEFLVVQPPDDIAVLLNMEADEFAYYVCRTRLLDGEPSNVERTYMPIKVIPDLREKHVQGSIYSYIEGELGLRIASAHRAICAVHPSDDDARWLGVEHDTPLISVRQVSYLDDGTPFEQTTVTHHPGYEFYTVSTK